MKMRVCREGDIEQVMEIADAGWRSIRQMSRETLGDVLSDILNPGGDAKSKGLRVRRR